MAQQKDIQENMTEQDIRVGDRVQLPGHFSDDSWKTGTVIDIYKGNAWIRYGFPLYGISGAVNISELERVN